MSSDTEDLQLDRIENQQAALEQQRLEEEFNRKFPNRPINHGPSLPFHVLYQDLFDPLTDNLRRKHGNLPSGRKAGPNNVPSTNPFEVRRGIIERFISRWRTEVGDDFFPAMRLIIPEKDRERAMYGLKEKALAKYLVKLMKIDKNSDDGFNLLNWKLPGQNSAARNAGDFAGRCYEVLRKRAHLIEPGNMTIDEVDEQLKMLSKESKEEKQLPIMEMFYKNMNADELTWLIRIITRSMKIGATERTILEVWHPDAEALFNVSSSLRRVCWELYDPKIRLESDDRGVKLGECYQPQLAHQPNMSFPQMVASMKPTEDDAEFWVEEKLDGERMQLHVFPNSKNPALKSFKFWSRHAKDYTYLYGDSFDDKTAALTKYIREGFHDGVESAIFDGEMITWSMEQDNIVPFGTLKTAALNQKTNAQWPERPFYRIFHILLLNGQVLTRYTLRDRRKALEATIKNVHRRMEILPYEVGTCADDIERSLRDVVTRASEGLVLKNPRSAYVLNLRLHDWIKVKPEYMTEFGESLDCLIIGGYYGSGHRGGELSSFLCGLRHDKLDGSKTKRFLSFFKVGGGMTTDDYSKLRHNTEGKWHKYDPANPPVDYVTLSRGAKQIEKPDAWIKPEDSLVVEVKAASVNASDDYAVKVTLRFPRFTRFRLDKNWESALSVEDFKNVKAMAEKKREEKKKEDKLQLTKRKQKTHTAPRKKQVVIAGYDSKDVNDVKYDEVKSEVFKGLTFYLMTESTKPEKRTKVELEQIVTENGGTVVQTADIKRKNDEEPEVEVFCIAERRTVKVASLEKRGKRSLIKPIWLFDCIRQAKIDFARGRSEMVVPLEFERHLFFAVDERKAVYENQADQHGDSYARDINEGELKDLMHEMGQIELDRDPLDKRDFLDPSDCRGGMFFDCVFWFDDTNRNSIRNDSDGSNSTITKETLRMSTAKFTARFAGASIAKDLNDSSITHVVLGGDSDKKAVRKEIASRKKLPRVVSLDWIEECWNEHTRIDEERFAIV